MYHRPASALFFIEMGKDTRATDGLLADVIASALRRCGGEWETFADEFWCHVSLPGAPLARQGWKLHVSATPLSAPHVLAATAPILLDAGCHFKFARSVAAVSELVSTRFARGGAGKFLTVYAPDAQLAELAWALDAATFGLAGPAILSDRPLRPGSLVHYRYGVFLGHPLLSVDGAFEVRLQAPDGSLVRDRREASFTPPSWALPPFAGPRPPRGPGALVLAGRYEIRGAIQHANKGGVYRGVDRATGSEIVIKHARAHAASTLGGTDARDALRNEATMLERLAGIAPALVATVPHGADTFLVEELVSGRTLRAWVQEAVDHDRGLRATVATKRARQLTDLVSIAHAAGVVLRDFNPNNVMVTGDGTLRLVDLECAAVPGTPVVNAYTLAYAAPEVLALPAFGPAPGGTVDLFSLGMTLFYLATGVDPAFPADDDTVRSIGERLQGVIGAMAGRNRGLAILAPAILGLTASDPSERWSVDDVRASLAGDRVARVGRGDALAVTAPFDDLLQEGIDHLLSTVAWSGERLWPSGGFGSATDPCNVQHGAAGVLAVLARASEALIDPGLALDVRAIGSWVVRRAAAVPSALPGLYFGRAGAAWALSEAGRATGDSGLQVEALELARALPVRWPNPDICHGAAGLGLTLLHLWEATGEAWLRDRVLDCADGLLEAAHRGPHGIHWPIPADFDSELAGLRSLGFAHGVAGVGTFLLAAGVSLGSESLLAAARDAGSSLCAAAVVRHGEALWPREVGGSIDSARSVYWCDGASGIGSFLIRLWASGEGDARHRTLAEQAACAVHRRRWLGSAVTCHGIAGGAEFLLDLAAAGCGERYRDQAAELAAGLYRFDARVGDRRVVADETQRTITADFNTGLSGVLGLLLRLGHGGPRWFMPDDLTLTVTPALDAALSEVMA